MNSLLYWAALCLAISIFLFFVEIFIPSGGLLGVMSALALVTGIFLIFRVNTSLGLVGAIVSVLAIPFLFMLAIKLWPNTPLFRLLLLKNPTTTQTVAEQTPQPGEELLNAKGTALTQLRPVGTCLIGEQRYECLSESGMIPVGTTVQVVAVDGMQIKVRPAPPGT
ncbi:MAG: hypothetical protein IT443_08490 [Phycisphaeraceae bacterium]|nr:hypothetical protein [Phycisphaeraceae bacterium]